MNQIYDYRIPGNILWLMMPPHNFYETPRQIPMLQKTGPYLCMVNSQNPLFCLFKGNLLFKGKCKNSLRIHPQKRS